MLNETKDGPQGVVMFDIGMLILSEGRERSRDEYINLLSKAGFGCVKSRQLNDTVFHDIVMATKS